MSVETERKYLTEEELKKLLKVIESPRDRAIFLVCYWRGLRAAEIGKLPFSAWRATARTLYVVRLKGSLAGEFPLSPAEHRALTAWAEIRGKEPGPLFPSRESGGGALSRYAGLGISRFMMHRLMRRYATAAGLPPRLRHMHVLKHSCGTHLIAKGVELYAVKDWMGHKSISSTLVYAQFRNKQRDECAQRVYDQELLK